MDALMAKLKAICDERRIRILKLLAQRELCACDFIENIDLPNEFLELTIVYPVKAPFTPLFAYNKIAVYQYL